MSEKSKYKYYAFISYAREDKAVVKYVQRFLEHFRYDGEKVGPELQPDDPKYLRKVVVDISELSARKVKFEAEIREKLAQSRYLIVVCSPFSAEKKEDSDRHWVNWEVEEFLRSHNGNLDAIFPVLYDGNPNPEEGLYPGLFHYLPPLLRDEAFTSVTLPDFRPDWDELKKKRSNLRHNWENGVLQTISGLLNLEREEVRQRHYEEERRRKRRQVAIATVVMMFLIALTLWAMFERSRARRNAQIALKNERVAVANEKKAEENERLALENEKQAQQQRDIAVEQANIAKKTLEFMESVLKSSDPSSGGNKDITVLEVMDIASESAKTMDPWQVKASVLRAIGRVLHSYGQQEEAKPLIEESVELYRSHGMEDTEEISDSYTTLSLIYDFEGDHQTAVEYGQDCLRICRKVLGEQNKSTATCYGNLGMILAHQGDYDKALEYCERSLAINRILFGEMSPEVALSYNNLSVICKTKGDTKKALEYLHESWKISVNLPDRNNWRTLITLGNIASALSLQGEYKSALEIWLGLLADFRAMWGENHFSVARAYNQVGLQYYHMKQIDKAIENYQKAIDIVVSTRGERHLEVAAMYDDMGVAYSEQGEYSKALENHLKALDIEKEILGESHIELARTYNNIGRVYTRQADYASALENFKHSLKLQQQFFGKNHPTIGFSYYNIATVYKYSGKENLALGYYRRALNIWEKDSHPHLKDCYLQIGDCFVRQKDYPNAQEYYQKALEIYLNKSLIDIPEVATIYDSLGFIYLQQENHQQALEMFQKSLAIHQKILSNSDPFFAIDYNNIGKAYCGLKKYSEAEKNLRKSIEIAEKSDMEEADIARIHFSLGLVLFAKGTPDEAMEEYQKSKAIYEEQRLLDSPDGKELIENMRICQKVMEEKPETRDFTVTQQVGSDSSDDENESKEEPNNQKGENHVSAESN